MSELLWHHGNISKAEAVRRFRQFHPDGSFLMRNSETVMNAFVLSIGFQNNVYHYRILQDTNRRFIFEDRIYYSLTEIVEYYGTHRGCLVCTLKHPVLPPLPTGLGDVHYDEPTMPTEDFAAVYQIRNKVLHRYVLIALLPNHPTAATFWDHLRFA